ncbi:hypothetical protein [uncultured Sphingomonas sp.]|nr:hypothetical protein [uncultured Sphingomonas sp.]
MSDEGAGWLCARAELLMIIEADAVVARKNPRVITDTPPDIL